MLAAASSSTALGIVPASPSPCPCAAARDSSSSPCSEDADSDASASSTEGSDWEDDPRVVLLRGPYSTSRTYMTALPGTLAELEAKAAALFRPRASAGASPGKEPRVRLMLGDHGQAQLCPDALPALNDRELLIVRFVAPAASEPAEASSPGLHRKRPRVRFAPLPAFSAAAERRATPSAAVVKQAQAAIALYASTPRRTPARPKARPHLNAPNGLPYCLPTPRQQPSPLKMPTPASSHEHELPAPHHAPTHAVPIVTPPAPPTSKSHPLALPSVAPLLYAAASPPQDRAPPAPLKPAPIDAVPTLPAPSEAGANAQAEEQVAPTAPAVAQKGTEQPPLPLPVPPVDPASASLAQVQDINPPSPPSSATASAATPPAPVEPGLPPLPPAEADVPSTTPPCEAGETELSPEVDAVPANADTTSSQQETPTSWEGMETDNGRDTAGTVAEDSAAPCKEAIQPVASELPSVAQAPLLQTPRKQPEQPRDDMDVASSDTIVDSDEPQPHEAAAMSSSPLPVASSSPVSARTVRSPTCQFFMGSKLSATQWDRQWAKAPSESPSSPPSPASSTSPQRSSPTPCAHHSTAAALLCSPASPASPPGRARSRATLHAATPSAREFISLLSSDEDEELSPPPDVFLQRRSQKQPRPPSPTRAPASSPTRPPPRRGCPLKSRASQRRLTAYRPVASSAATPRKQDTVLSDQEDDADDADLTLVRPASRPTPRKRPASGPAPRPTPTLSKRPRRTSTSTGSGRFGVPRSYARSPSLEAGSEEDEVWSEKDWKEVGYSPATGHTFCITSPLDPSRPVLASPSLRAHRATPSASAVPRNSPTAAPAVVEIDADYIPALQLLEAINSHPASSLFQHSLKGRADAPAGCPLDLPAIKAKLMAGYSARKRAVLRPCALIHTSPKARVELEDIHINLVTDEDELDELESQRYAQARSLCTYARRCAASLRAGYAPAPPPPPSSSPSRPRARRCSARPAPAALAAAPQAAPSDAAAHLPRPRGRKGKGTAKRKARGSAKGPSLSSNADPKRCSSTSRRRLGGARHANAA